MTLRVKAVTALALSCAMALLVAGMPRAGAGADSPARAPDLSQHRVYLNSLRKPALQLRWSGRRGFSRIGGRPVLPPGFAWPSWKGQPLAFLCQIDLGALPADAATAELPRAGFLYFFYSAEQETWGFDPMDAGSWRVFYFDRLERATEVALPPALRGKGAYAEVPLAFLSALSSPDLQDDRLTHLKLTDAQAEAYAALRSRAFGGEPEHQLLGYASPIQGNDMDLECQLASHGLKTRDDKSPRYAALAAGRAEWRLLLQLDSDGRAGMTWGDGGRLYFWITAKDLSRRDFSKVWMILQCY
jgi:uncharacterized protein YwqG